MAIFGQDTIRFLIVGSGGFLVDGLIFSYLVEIGEWNPLSARVVSISFAVLCTWFAHRYWTFPTGRLRSPLHQTAIYALVQLTGLFINYGIFAALIFSGSLWRTFPILAVAVGSLSAMVVTYLLSKTIAFAEPRSIARK
jgi:putative flippase GtrA